MVWWSDHKEWSRLMPTVTLVNHSHLVTQAQLNAYVSALQQQVSRDLQSTWGLTATLSIAVTPPSTSWVLGIFNNADQADALGYHDVTPKGLPLGKVFAQT